MCSLSRLAWYIWSSSFNLLLLFVACFVATNTTRSTSGWGGMDPGEQGKVEKMVWQPSASRVSGFGWFVSWGWDILFGRLLWLTHLGICVGVLNNNLNHDIVVFVLAFEKVVVPAKSCKIVWINPYVAYVEESHQLIFFPRQKPWSRCQLFWSEMFAYIPCTYLHYFATFGCFIPWVWALHKFRVCIDVVDGQAVTNGRNESVAFFAKRAT